MAAAAVAGLPQGASAQLVTDRSQSELAWNKAPCRFCGTGCGVLVATVDVVFFSHVLLATDLAFAATAGGDRLVDAFVEWARTKRAVLVEMMSSQDEKFEQFGRLLRRKGFTRSGSAYRLNLKEGAR